jgi:hypothetical protein
VLFGQISHSVNFSSDKLSSTTEIAKNGTNYERITIEGFSLTNEIGKPSMPVKYISLIIPSNQDVDNIVITFSDKQELSGSYLIFPAQPPIPTSANFHEPHFIEPDPAVYGSDMPYPSEIVKFIHDDYFDGKNHIATLAAYPLQYLPKSGRIVFFSHIEFRLEFKPATGQRLSSGRRSERSQNVYDQLLNQIVDNPEDIPSYQIRPSLGKISGIQSVPFKSYEYVVITSSDLASQFEPLITWKTRKGYKAGVVTTDEIFAHYTTARLRISCNTLQVS